MKSTESTVCYRIVGGSEVETGPTADRRRAVSCWLGGPRCYFGYNLSRNLRSKHGLSPSAKVRLWRRSSRCHCRSPSRCPSQIWLPPGHGMEYTPTSQAPSRPICPDIRGEASIPTPGLCTPWARRRSTSTSGEDDPFSISLTPVGLPEPRWRSPRQNAHTWSMRHRETRLCSLDVHVEFLLRLDHPLAPRVLRAASCPHGHERRAPNP